MNGIPHCSPRWWRKSISTSNRITSFFSWWVPVRCTAYTSTCGHVSDTTDRKVLTSIGCSKYTREYIFLPHIFVPHYLVFSDAALHNAHTKWLTFSILFTTSPSEFAIELSMPNHLLFLTAHGFLAIGPTLSWGGIGASLSTETDGLVVIGVAVGIGASLSTEADGFEADGLAA